MLGDRFCFMFRQNKGVRYRPRSPVGVLPLSDLDPAANCLQTDSAVQMRPASAAASRSTAVSVARPSSAPARATVTFFKPPPPPQPPTLPSSYKQMQFRKPPRLPAHVAASALPPQHASFVAARLTPRAARQWACAWSGCSPHRKAPAAPTLDPAVKRQADAGGLLMQIALSTPTARVAWRQHVLETEQDESRLLRERLEQERKQEVLRINSTITHRPPPSALGDWQPPSPSRTAGGWGKCLDKGPPEDLVSKEWQLAKASRLA